MNSLLTYLIQSGLILSLFFLGYRFLLSNETGFFQNRFFLLTGIMASTIIPGLPLSVSINQDATKVVWLKEVIIQPGGLVNTVASEMSSSNIILMLYLAGALFFSLRLITRLLNILLLVKRHGISRKGNDNIVLLSGDYAPFSILNLIFVNVNDLNKISLDKVLAHERIHIRQKHSIDLLLIELLTVIQWFNPFVWLYKHAIKANHEYLADQGVLDGGYNKISYQNLLLNQVFGMQINYLTNNFNNSLIKRRLTMMSNIKNSKIPVWKYIFLVPVTLGIAMFITISFSSQVIAQDQQAQLQMQESKQIEKQDPPQIQKEEDTPIFTVVDDMPTFKGGKDALFEYLSTNIKYPEEAKKNGVEGTCFVTYVVEKDGSISNVKVLRGIGAGCDEEAIRVIENMPDWNPANHDGKPVRVQFNIPIKFKLDNNKKSEDKNG